jgi:hypothetical protein
MECQSTDGWNIPADQLPKPRWEPLRLYKRTRPESNYVPEVVL